MRTASLLPPPTLPHPPGAAQERGGGLAGDEEGARGLLSGPRPGGAPGDPRRRCQPGPRGRGGKDPNPPPAAEVRGGVGQAVSDARLSQWESSLPGPAPQSSSGG